MKWFKHMADMSMDVRVRRLIRAYGIEGYGLYVYILEHIVRKLETETPIPDLEESSSDIASDTNMDTVKVEQIMWFCIEQGLFDQDEMSGRILASKIYKFLQASETRSDKIRAMIKAYKGGKSPLLVSQTVTDNSEEQNRTEQNRTEQKSVEIGSYFTVTASQWERFTADYYEADLTDLAERMNDWIDAKHGGKSPYKDYAAALRTWIKKANLSKRMRETPSPLEQARREAH